MPPRRPVRIIEKSDSIGQVRVWHAKWQLPSLRSCLSRLWVVTWIDDSIERTEGMRRARRSCVARRSEARAPGREVRLLGILW